MLLSTWLLANCEPLLTTRLLLDPTVPEYASSAYTFTELSNVCAAE